MGNRIAALGGRGEAPAPEPLAPEPKSLWRRPKSILIGAIGIFILWMILTRSLAIYYADGSPGAALFLHRGMPKALLNSTEDVLSRDPHFQTLPPVVRVAPEASNSSPGAEAGDGGSGADATQDGASPEANAPAAGATSESAAPANPESYASYRYSAEQALRGDPLSARAFRMLGQISALGPDEKRTEALMRAAVRRSLLESGAVYWLMGKSYRDQNYSLALAYADVLLRTNPSSLRAVAPMLGKLAETPAASAELKQLLASNPPWRWAFFSRFPTTITDARTPLDILLTLKETASPPTPAELQNYLDFLIHHHFYDLAYYTWLQFLSGDELTKAGYLFNGKFETQPTGLPFDWVIPKRPGIRFAITPRPDRKLDKAFKLEFGPGRVDYKDIAQVIVLPPGSYKLQGQFKSELTSARGLEWKVSCAGKTPSLIGTGPTMKGTTAVWTDFDVEFTVPETNCPAQKVHLTFDARSASEQFISGSMWFDDMQIARQATPEPVAAEAQPSAPPAPQQAPQPQASQPQAAQPPEAQPQPQTQSTAQDPQAPAPSGGAPQETPLPQAQASPEAPQPAAQQTAPSPEPPAAAAPGQNMSTPPLPQAATPPAPTTPATQAPPLPQAAQPAFPAMPVEEPPLPLAVQPTPAPPPADTQPPQPAPQAPPAQMPQ